ncbi:MAG: chemotaxis protein CheW [Campylobacterales bacterium]|nr:chemotaxis protein CheW [Campylobacterales bacterium]
MAAEYHNEIQDSIDYITKSHHRNVMQLAVFRTSSDKIYAINISKIKSFLIKDEVTVLKTPSSNELVEGVIDIRGDVISVVNFDYWIEEPVNKDEYKIIIVCSYNEKKIGLLVKDIIKIEEKESDSLKTPSTTDPKVSYITEIVVDEESNKTQMCIVFDAERLLFDVNSDSNDVGTTIYDIDSFGSFPPINSNGLVLIAEDSRIVIEKLTEFCDDITLNYEIFENGQLLIDRLGQLAPEQVKLVITDIEMPIKNGYQVIKFIKENGYYEHIPVYSLTSMTNQGMLDKIRHLGAIDLINKSNLPQLYKEIKKTLDGRF